MEEERGKEIVPNEEESIRIPRRKVTLQLIEERSLRKACYKKRREGLLKKMEEITTLCAIDACMIIRSPDEVVPTMWPSPDVAKQLIQRFQSIPETERCKRMVDHHSFIQEKVKRMEHTLTRLKESNEEKQMSIFMYQLRYEGKPVSDFNLDETKRLLNYIDEKLKAIRLNGGTDLLILPSQRDDFGSKIIGGSDSIVSFHGNVRGLTTGGSDLVTMPQSNFRGLIGENDSMTLSHGNFEGFNGQNSLEILPQSDTEGLISAKDSTMLSHGNFRDLTGESDLGMLSQSNFGDLNGQNDLETLLQSNFEDFNGENNLKEMLPQTNFGDLHSPNNLEMLLQSNFGDFNGENNLEMLPETNFEGLNGQNDLGMLSHSNSACFIDGNDSSHGNFGDLSNQNNLEILLQRNFGDFNGENNLGMLPHTNVGDLNSGSNFEGFNNGNSDLWSAPQSMFEVLNAEIDAPIQGNNFGAPIVENDFMGVPQLNSIGINGEENLGVFHGSLATGEIGGSSNLAPYGIGSAIGGNGMATEQNNENYNEHIDNIAGLQQFNPINADSFGGN